MKLLNYSSEEQLLFAPAEQRITDRREYLKISDVYFPSRGINELEIGQSHRFSFNFSNELSMLLLIPDHCSAVQGFSYMPNLSVVGVEEAFFLV